MRLHGGCGCGCWRLVETDFETVNKTEVEFKYRDGENESRSSDRGEAVQEFMDSMPTLIDCLGREVNVNDFLK